MLLHWFSVWKSGKKKSQSFLAQHKEVGRTEFLKRKAEGSARSAPAPHALRTPRIATRGRCRTPAGFSLLPGRGGRAPDPALSKSTPNTLQLARNERKKQVSLKILNFTGAATLKCCCPYLYCDPTGILKHFQHITILLYPTTSSCSAT